MSNILKKLFFQGDTWKIAYRRTQSNILNDKSTPFSILKLPKGYWGADPFLFQKDSKIYVFFELTDFKKRKSLLACKELFNEEDKIKIVHEFDYHCSYPCIFSINSNIYIVPETVQTNQIILLKCVEFPYLWHMNKILFDNYSSVDSTIRQCKDKTYLLTYNISNKKSYETNVFECTNNFNIQPNPIHTSCTISDIRRPAGHFMEMNGGEYIRPVQPSNNFYGEKIVFLHGDNNWNEKEITSISIKDIVLSEKKYKKYIGLHTYNKLDSIEVIDIAEMSFRPFKIFEYIFRKLNIFGYGLYDAKEKKISNKLNPKYFDVFND